MSWCAEVRQKHALKDSFVIFPTERSEEKAHENRAWRVLLNVEDIVLKDPRVWVGHFEACNLILELNAVSGTVEYQGIKKIVNAQGKGVSARPTSTKYQAQTFDLLLAHAGQEQFRRNANSELARKKRKNLAQCDDHVQTGPQETTPSVPGVSSAQPAPAEINKKIFRRNKRGTKLGKSKPFVEAFAGHVECLLQLTEVVQHHAVVCGDELVVWRHNVKHKGLALRMKLCCRRGSAGCKFNCTDYGTLWNNESKSVSWLSSELYVGSEYSDPSFKPVPLVDALFAYGTAVAPVKKKHAEALSLDPATAPDSNCSVIGSRSCTSYRSFRCRI